MVIGCVEVGKIIFVKKLKGEKDFSIKLISGIEIYFYVFKLYVNELIIIGKLDFKFLGVLGICCLLIIFIFDIFGFLNLFS